VDRVIFAADLTEYAFVGVILSGAKFMGGEYLNESDKVTYKGFPLSSVLHWNCALTLICPV